MVSEYIDYVCIQDDVRRRKSLILLSFYVKMKVWQEKIIIQFRHAILKINQIRLDVILYKTKEKSVTLLREILIIKPEILIIKFMTLFYSS